MFKYLQNNEEQKQYGISNNEYLTYHSFIGKCNMNKYKYYGYV